MASKNKKIGAQRRAYTTARSLIRYLKRPTKDEAGKEKMVIFTNVQTAAVAGITRVMSSFVAHAQKSPELNVEMFCATLGGPEEHTHEAGWQKTIDVENKITTLVYTGALPAFPEVLERAHAMRDVRREFTPLIEAFAAELREINPSVVLINGTTHVAWCLLLAARRLSLPVVVYYHGSITKETEHWENEKVKRIICHIEASFSHSDIRYVFPSGLIKWYVEKKVFNRTIPARHVLILPNPIPEEFFSAQHSQLRTGIGIVGRWTRIKNTAFIKRFVYNASKQEDPPLIYLVTDARSKQKAVKILHDQVRFVDPFEQSESMAEFYAKMRVVICPSHFETYGNVAQEAVAAGTAALVSRNMGIAEVFRHIGLERLIISFADPEAVLRIIGDKRRLVITKSERLALKAVASAEVVHEKLLQFIRTII